jgi:hypothetical protein
MNRSFWYGFGAGIVGTYLFHRFGKSLGSGKGG